MKREDFIPEGHFQNITTTKAKFVRARCKDERDNEGGGTGEVTASVRQQRNTCRGMRVNNTTGNSVNGRAAERTLS